MYVVIEGIDTSGKSTQISLLKNVYHNAIFTQEPSASDFGKVIRELALYGGLDNKTQALLFIADRANHTKQLLLPNKDKLIISDRSLVSGIAYASSIDFELSCNINLSVSMKPDLAIVLELDSNTLKQRLSTKDNDNIESIGVSALMSIQDRIFDAINKLHINYVSIPATLHPHTILDTITKHIDKLQ